MALALHSIHCGFSSYYDPKGTGHREIKLNQLLLLGFTLRQGDDTPIQRPPGPCPGQHSVHYHQRSLTSSDIQSMIYKHDNTLNVLPMGRKESAHCAGSLGSYLTLPGYKLGKREGLKGRK